MKAVGILGIGQTHHDGIDTLLGPPDFLPSQSRL